MSSKTEDKQSGLDKLIWRLYENIWKYWMPWLVPTNWASCSSECWRPRDRLHNITSMSEYTKCKVPKFDHTHFLQLRCTARASRQENTGRWSMSSVAWWKTILSIISLLHVSPTFLILIILWGVIRSCLPTKNCWFYHVLEEACLKGGPASTLRSSMAPRRSSTLMPRAASTSSDQRHGENDENGRSSDVVWGMSLEMFSS